MAARVTIKDIAREAGVGLTSVSRALNDQPGLAPETRERILAVAKRLDFTPNPHARSLKVKHNPGAISALVKGPANLMFQVLGDHLETLIRERGYTYETVRVANQDDEYAVAERVISVDKPAGVLLLGGTVDPTPEQVASVGLPFVLLTTPRLRHIDEGSYSSVHVDDEAAVALQVQSLVDRGHRRIAYIGMPSTEHSAGAIRLEAFVAAMDRLGLPSGEPYLLSAETDRSQYYTFDYGYRLTKELLDEGTDATAICAASDTIALGAHKAILERGFRIPEDFAVVGFDGIEQTRWVNPELATVEQPLAEMAQAACELLFAQIERGEAHRHVVVPARIIERDSLGGAR